MDKGPTVIRLRKLPQDVNKIIMREQNRMREEKGYHVAKDAVIYAIIRNYNDGKGQGIEVSGSDLNKG